MLWSYTHGGSLAALPEVGLLGKGCWHIVRVPQILCLTPLPGLRSSLLFLASRYGHCSRQCLFHVAWNPPLSRARDCPSLPLRIASLSLMLSRSEVPGPHVLLCYYVARVIFLWSGGPVQFCRPSWVVSLVLQNLIGAPWSSSGHTKCVFLILKALFILASASAGRIGCSMLCLFVALFLGAGVGCPLLSSRASWRRLWAPPPLLLGLRASLYRPNQLETIAMGDCYILCGRSGVTCSAWAAHHPRCERFLFAAGCSMKELSKTTVSFCSGCRCHGCAGSRSRNVLFCVP